MSNIVPYHPDKITPDLPKPKIDFVTSIFESLQRKSVFHVYRENIYKSKQLFLLERYVAYTRILLVKCNNSK